MDPYKFPDEVTHGWHARRQEPPKLKPIPRRAKAFATMALLGMALAADVTFTGYAYAATSQIVSFAPDASSHIASKFTAAKDLFWDTINTVSVAIDGFRK